MMLGNGCQGLKLRERRWSHGVPRDTERERDENFWFCKKGKSKRGRVFEIFSGDDARQWLWRLGVERKREDGGTVRESKDGEREFWFCWRRGKPKKGKTEKGC